MNLLLKSEDRCVPFVFFESGLRLKNTLKIFQKYLDDNVRVFLCKELTKKFETLLRGNCNELLQKIENVSLKGEWTVERIKNYLMKHEKD